MQDDVALAVVGDSIAAIGATDQILKSYPMRCIDAAEGDLPGLVNCHAHLTATLERGFTRTSASRIRASQGATVSRFRATKPPDGDRGALEAIRTGTTTFVENAGGIGRYAAALAKTGLRWVFAESIRDARTFLARCRRAAGEKRDTAFLSKVRDEGLQRAPSCSALACRTAAASRVSRGGTDRDLVAQLLKAVRAFRRQEKSGTRFT